MQGIEIGEEIFSSVEEIYPAERGGKILRKFGIGADSVHRLVDFRNVFEVLDGVLLPKRCEGDLRQLLHDRRSRFIPRIIDAALIQPRAQLLVILSDIHQLLKVFEIVFETGVQTFIGVEECVKFVFVFLEIFIERTAASVSSFFLVSVLMRWR